MWIETSTGLINTDHVQKIILVNSYINFCRPQTPETGSPNDKYRDIIGQRRCASAEEAKELYDRLMVDIEAIPNSRT